MKFLISPFVAQVILIFSVSLLIGCSINTVVGQRSLGGDEPDYVKLAAHLNQTREYGWDNFRAYRAPFYPAVLSLPFRIFGESQMVARYTNSVFGALMAVGAFCIAFLLTNRGAVGIIAAGMLCLNSYWWLNQTMVMQENLAAILLVLSFLLILLSWRYVFSSKGILLTASGGCFFGLSQLAKPSFIPMFGFIVVIIAFWFIARKHFSVENDRRMCLVVLFIIFAVIPIASWSIRNYLWFNKFVPITTGSGVVFWGSHAPSVISGKKGGWSNVMPHMEKEERRRFEADELERDVIFWRKGWNSLAAAPIKDVFLHFVMKIARVCSPSVFFVADSLPLKILKMLLVCLNFLILAGFIGALITRIEGWQILAFLCLGLLATAFVFWGTIRFRYVISPLICTYSAVFYWHLFNNGLSFFVSRAFKRNKPWQ